MLTVFFVMFILTQFRAGRRVVRAMIEQKAGTVNIKLLDKYLQKKSTKFPF